MYEILQYEKDCHCECTKDLSRHVLWCTIRTVSERNRNEWITFNLSSFSFGLKKLLRKIVSLRLRHKISGISDRSLQLLWLCIGPQWFSTTSSVFGRLDLNGSHWFVFFCIPLASTVWFNVRGGFQVSLFLPLYMYKL